MRIAVALLASVACTSAVYLPSKTVSEVCPALSFEQDIQATPNGSYKFSFKPIGEYSQFKFVDLHVVVEDEAGKRIGEQRNYNMNHLGNNRYELSISDDNVVRSK
jgi:hypothetical protein